MEIQPWRAGMEDGRHGGVRGRGQGSGWTGSTVVVVGVKPGRQVCSLAQRCAHCPAGCQTHASLAENWHEAGRGRQDAGSRCITHGQKLLRHSIHDEHSEVQCETIQAIDSLMDEDDERSAKAFWNLLASRHNINIALITVRRHFDPMIHLSNKELCVLQAHAWIEAGKTFNDVIFTDKSTVST
ncbi:unnamed protein product, partial [Coregonus sp. 'balchen']